jgi:sec-independent protein translocase protein TatA
MTGFLTPTHILLLLLVVLMLFGAKRLPELGRSLGSGMREFKQSIGGGPTRDQDVGADEVTQLKSTGEPPAVQAATAPPVQGPPSPPAA